MEVAVVLLASSIAFYTMGLFFKPLLS